MGVLDSPVDEGVGSTFVGAKGPIERTGFFSNVSAGYRESQAGPGSTRSRQNAAEARYYDQIIGALTAEGEMGADKIEVRPGGWGYTGPKDVPVNQYGVGFIDKRRPFRNPYTDAPALSQGDNPLARLYLGGDLLEKAAIWEAVKRVRARRPDFLKDMPDEPSLTARAEADRQRRLAEAQEVTSRAGTRGKVGAFIGNVAGSIVAGDPENFVGLGVGGAASKTVARTVLKRGVQEGTINAGAGVLALPGQVVDAERMGIEMTPADMVRAVEEQAAIGFLFGGVSVLAPIGGRKAKKVVGKGAEAAIDLAARIPAVRDTIASASLRAGTVLDRADLREYRRLHSPYTVGDTSTPDERAAAHVIERDVEVREASPLRPEAAADNERRIDAVAASLGVDLTPPRLPPSAPVQHPTVKPSGAPRQPATYTDAVHRAEGTGDNPDSTAFGHFQFIENTWLEYAPRVVDTKGMSRAQILALRKDKGVATRAENLFRADNAAYLRARGAEDSPGNLSLAHFLGKADAAKVLRAAPDTPIEQLVDPRSMRSNQKVLSGKTAAQIIQWAHRRIGAAVPDTPARPDAVPDYDATDEMDYSAVRPYGSTVFRPDEVETDAALMQYKAGGDEAGVTDKLQGVTNWNPLLSSEIMVWEGLDGRRVVVDGHQRTGLARRLYPQDDSIRLPAIVIRETDGITAEQARVLGALRNINLGTGTLIDNARVLRDAPNGSAMLKGAEHRREIEGLSRLSYEAFGAAVNDVIPPQLAAQIGLHASGQPEAHMPLVDLLLKERIHNPREAASIIRQAMADGYGTAAADQLTMFGDMPAQSLYVPIARILETAAKRLRDEKRTFRTLASQAGRIEKAGNVLDRAANEGKVITSDEALAILNATAHSSGPVRDALIAAARAELSGTRRGDAVGGFLDALAGIDLRAAAQGVGRDGGSGKSSGEEGGADAAAAADGDVPGRGEPSLFDQAVDTATRAETFSDPVGEGAKGQIELLEHDLLMDAGANERISVDELNDSERADLVLALATERIPGFNMDVWERQFGEVQSYTDDQIAQQIFGLTDPLTVSRITLDPREINNTNRATSDRAVATYSEMLKTSPTPPALIVAKVEGVWKILEGGHRLRAAKESGLTAVNAIDVTPLMGMDWATYLAGDTSPDMPLQSNLRTDPNITARQVQEATLKAEAAMRSVEEQGGTMGLALFDIADQPTFRLDEEGDARPIADILNESQADEIAAKNAKDCLK